VSTKILARGVFDGVGRIVEVPNLAGDPDNVSRDDLVFRAGAMHLVSANQTVKLSIDPQTCLFTLSSNKIGTLNGGTRAFAHVSGTFKGSVAARGTGATEPGRQLFPGAGPIVRS
jgi:hypothetical protein